MDKTLRRSALLGVQAAKVVTIDQWEEFLHFVLSGSEIRAAMKAVGMSRTTYTRLTITDPEKREQVELARDEWLRSAWPDETIDAICVRVAQGELAKDAIVAEAPVFFDDPLSAFYHLIAIDAVARDKHMSARQAQMWGMSDDIIEIADNDVEDLIEGPRGLTSNPSAVRRSEVRVKTRQWMMEKLHSKQFGNKVDASLTVEVKDHAAELADARLRKKNAAEQQRARLNKIDSSVVSTQ